MSAGEIILGALKSIGINEYNNNDLAKHSLARINDIINGNGYSKYRPAGTNNEKHPLNKIEQNIKRLEHSINEYYHSPDKPDEKIEYNGCDYFYSSFKLITGHDPAQLLRLMKQAIEASKNAGLDRPGHAPSKLLRDEFCAEMYFLLRSQTYSVDKSALIELIISSQSALPEKERETRKQIIARVDRLYKKSPIAKWEISIPK
jgi:hypothetical protein